MGDRLGDGGVFSILDKISEAVAKFDLAGSGPEGEPFADIAAKNGEEEEEESQDGAVQKQPYAYVSPVSHSVSPSVSLSSSESYTGFGLNSWQSGPQAFPDLTSFYSGNLARAFSSSSGSGEFGDLVKATLTQLNKAVSVKSH